MKSLLAIAIITFPFLLISCGSCDHGPNNLHHRWQDGFWTRRHGARAAG